MLLAGLIVANIPVYIFLGWVVFDTKDQAAENFFQTVVTILKWILIPAFIRVFMEDDSDGPGMLTTALFLGACIAATWGEYWLIQTYWLGDNASQF